MEKHVIMGGFFFRSDVYIVIMGMTGIFGNFFVEHTVTVRKGC